MDREKVIKGLQAHANGCGYRSHHCDVMDCPYRYGDESCDIEEMCRDAIALLKEQEDALEQMGLDNEDLRKCYTELLKEQEAVEPKKVKGYKPPMYTLYEYECEECKSPIMNKQPFCMGCGKSVKWK